MWRPGGGSVYLEFEADPIRSVTRPAPTCSLIVKVMLPCTRRKRHLRVKLHSFLELALVGDSLTAWPLYPHHNYAGSCAGRRASLDALGKTNSCCQCRGSSHDSPIAIQRYTRYWRHCNYDTLRSVPVFCTSVSHVRSAHIVYKLSRIGKKWKSKSLQLPTFTLSSEQRSGGNSTMPARTNRRYSIERSPRG